MLGVIFEIMGMDIFVKVECGLVEKYLKRRFLEY